MRIRLLGAASLAAIVSLGMVACTKKAEYSESDTATRTAEESSTTNTYASNEPDETTTTTTTTTTTEPDPYGATDPYASTPTTTAQTTTTSDQYGVTTAGEVIEIAEINTKADAERIASDAFDKADANGDGKLDRAEYVMIAMGANEFRASATSPIDETQEGIGEGDIDTGDAVGTTAPEDSSMPSTATAMDMVDETSVGPAFTEAAGADNSLTKEELRTAFLARFDKADADKDQQLSEEERQTFAQLTTGEPKP